MVCRWTVIDDWDMSQFFILDIPGHQFLHHFLCEGQVTKCQAMNFPYVTLLTRLFLKWLMVFWKSVGSNHSVYMYFIPSEEPVITACSLLYCVLISCCAQNTRNI